MKNNSWIARVIRQVLRWPLFVRLLIGAVTAAVPIYFSGYLSYSISVVAAREGRESLGVHAVIFLVLIAVTIFVARYVVAVSEQLSKEEQARVTMRLLSYTYLDRQLVSEARHVTDGEALNGHFVERFVASRESLQTVVEAAYAAFETAYGSAARTEERIDFEVTFMTKSYADGSITIPAYANRDGRAPRSMVLRPKRSDIYDNTVTAMVYREPRPRVHIIEDTSDPGANYQELYPEQKQRIRSSIIFPVLAHTNELLGTLVVHCDRPGFFMRMEEKFWTDVLEIFAKRLALAKLKLDTLTQAARAGRESLTVPLSATPF